MQTKEKPRPKLQGLVDNALSAPPEARPPADEEEQLSYRRLDRVVVVHMTRRMAALIAAGIPIPRVLTAVLDQEQNKTLKAALTRCAAKVNGGWYLSKALNLYPRLFPPIYVSMVKMGESIGDMPGMLNRLSEFLERDLKMEKKAHAAMVYPAFVCVFAVILVAGLFRFVLPPLLSTCVAMAGPRATLPIPTRILMTLIHWMEDPYVVLPALGIVFVLSFSLRHFVETPRARKRRDALLLSLPLIGDLNHKLLMARFCRSLGILVGAGVPITTCFDVIMGSIDNTVFNKLAVLPIVDGIKAGVPMAAVVEATGMFSPMVYGMIGVGEQTGNLSSMLARVSVFYDEQVEHALEVFLQLIEPVMVSAMGLLVCFIMVAVFLPLYTVVMAS